MFIRIQVMASNGDVLTEHVLSPEHQAVFEFSGERIIENGIRLKRISINPETEIICLDTNAINPK